MSPGGADLGAGFLCRAAREERGAVRATVEVDPGSPWFAGHFPGDPILPGIGQLDLLHRLRDRLGRRSHLAAVDALRLAELIRPGDRVEVELGPAAADGRTAVTMTRADGEPVSRGTLRWADAGAHEFGDAGPSAPSPPPSGPARPGAALALPHVHPARFAQEILEATAGEALCRGAVPHGHASVVDGRAPTLTAVEVAAQSAAGIDPGVPTSAIGYIVRLRAVRLPVPTLPAGAPLLARVRRDASHGPLTLLSFEVTTDADGKAELIGQGVLGVYLQER